MTYKENELCKDQSYRTQRKYKENEISENEAYKIHKVCALSLCQCQHENVMLETSEMLK